LDTQHPNIWEAHLKSHTHTYTYTYTHTYTHTPHTHIHIHTPHIHIHIHTHTHTTHTHTHSLSHNSHDLISIHNDLHALIHTLWLCDAHWHTCTPRCTKAQELMRNNQFPHCSGQRASASRKAEIPARTALMKSSPSLPGRAGFSIGD